MIEPLISIPYGMKTLHGIKFYDFMIAGRAVKFTSIILIARFMSKYFRTPKIKAHLLCSQCLLFHLC